MLKEVKIREVIIIYIISILIALAGSAIIVKYCDAKLNDTLVNYAILSIEILMVAMIILRLRMSLKTIKIIVSDYKKNIKLKEIIEVVLIYFTIAVGGSFLIFYFIYLLSPSLAYTFITQTSIIVNGPVDYIINLIYLAIIIPINEELIFRHIFFKRMNKRFPVYESMIVVAIIFAAINIGAGIIGAFCLSIINSILYMKYKNIAVPIVNRSIINIITIITLLPVLNHYRKYEVQGNVVLRNSILGFFMLCVGSFMFIKLIIKNKKYVDRFAANN